MKPNKPTIWLRSAQYLDGYWAGKAAFSVGVGATLDGKSAAWVAGYEDGWDCRKVDLGHFAIVKGAA